MEGTASQHEMRLQTDGLINGGPAPSMVDQESTGGTQQGKEAEGKCSLLATGNNRHLNGLYDKRLSCFGCGIGWFCFILGFVFPLLWYIATALYFGKYYLRDPRERAGLAASAIAALICSVAALITLLAFIL